MNLEGRLEHEATVLLQLHRGNDISTADERNCSFPRLRRTSRWRRSFLVHPKHVTNGQCFRYGSPPSLCDPECRES